jgi:hypothetical protein
MPWALRSQAVGLEVVVSVKLMHYCPLKKLRFMTAFSRIISGGQTGVDRAALDVALQLSLPCGGWCPKGRRAEDGPLDDCYPLDETPSVSYPQRTRWNVRDSDGTLILTHGRPKGGTALTIKLARALGKPVLVVDPAKKDQLIRAREWVESHQVRILNVAGPRESERPGIYAEAKQFLMGLLTFSDETPSPSPRSS